MKFLFENLITQKLLKHKTNIFIRNSTFGVLKHDYRNVRLYRMPVVFILIQWLTQDLFVNNKKTIPFKFRIWTLKLLWQVQLMWSNKVWVTMKWCSYDACTMHCCGVLNFGTSSTSLSSLLQCNEWIRVFNMKMFCSKY